MRTTPTFLLLAYFITINVLFFLPGSALPKVSWLNALHIDKWVHTGIFLLLGLLLFYNKWFINKPFLWMITAAAYGLAIEWAQNQWVANREFDIWDWVADVAGAALAVLVWRAIKK